MAVGLRHTAESQLRPRALWLLPPRPAGAGSPSPAFPRSLQSGPSTRVHVPGREHTRAHTRTRLTGTHSASRPCVFPTHTGSYAHSRTRAHTDTGTHSSVCRARSHRARIRIHWHTHVLLCRCTFRHTLTHTCSRGVSTLTHACVRTHWCTRTHTRVLTGVGISAGVPVCCSQL